MVAMPPTAAADTTRALEEDPIIIPFGEELPNGIVTAGCGARVGCNYLQPGSDRQRRLKEGLLVIRVHRVFQRSLVGRSTTGIAGLILVW
mmetsp:Transcript_37599/g.60351  ORF Transcript_37599/g.60351 Transcript_37599/m.60351 type:complete len:90 (-) Transcript_37599:19-288(-)